LLRAAAHGDVEIGSEKAWFDEADGDVEVADFVGKRFGVAFECELGGVVETVARGGDQTAERTDVDDSACAAGAHVRQDGLNHPMDAEEIRIEKTLCLVDRDFFDQAAEQAAGIIDKDVDLSLIGEDFIDGEADGIFACNVELEHGIFWEGHLAATCAVDDEIIFCQNQGGLAAEAGGSACDQDNGILRHKVLS